jgi:uncharacterized membrane protein YvlD (DUF360 family)
MPRGAQRETSTADGGSTWPLRDAGMRPRLRQVIGRGAAVTVANALAFLLLAAILPGFDVEGVGDALFAGLVVGLVNAVVWPALAGLVVPLSVLTLGIGAIVVQAVLVGLVLDSLPGIRLAGFWTSIAVVVGLSIVTSLTAALLAVNDDAWFDEYMARRARRTRRGRPTTDVPGVVFLQIDGLSEQVLRRSLSSGDAPTLHRWLHDGTHVLVGWRTDWSSQTGVSQCGILHGSTDGMPAFRWLEKATGRVLVSNHPESAAEIERRHSDGNGLLVHLGSSYGNLFSGDAERAVLTMSGAGRVKEGRIGAGYGRYFARPSNASRTLVATIGEIVRERRAAADQRRRGVEPRVSRDRVYALLRAFTTIISRDVCVNGILNDMAEGRAAIYCDFLGYDEVAHHSGPERADTLAVLRDIDHQIARIERAMKWSPRPYRIVVLSDHGQTQGASYADRYGETLAELVARLAGEESTVDADSEEGRTESSAWWRHARGEQDHDSTEGAGAAAGPTVLASGSLGLIYLPGEPRRLTLEEIDERYPQLVSGLCGAPGIGFVLVRSQRRGALVLGPSGSHCLDDGTVDGDDPLAPFGPGAADMVRRVDRCEDVADLMVNSTYDADLDEVAAFEHQVSSHGGLGGPQTHPFVLHPSDLRSPDCDVEGSTALHRVLKGWLVDLGHPVTVRA